MTTPTESFADDAAIVAAESAHRAPPPATEEYPTAPAFRHVMIVEPTGLTYVAPHRDVDDLDLDQCLRIPAAFRVFTDGARLPAPGRYWISVADDGNLEVGGRVPA